jgi:hypothetical protein
VLFRSTTIAGAPGPASDPFGYYSGYHHILFRASSTNFIREVFHALSGGSWTNNPLLSSATAIGAVHAYNSL